MDASARSFRASFPALDEWVHLNACSVPPLHRPAVEARRDAEREWERSPSPWDGWLARVDAARERFARLVNADVDEVAVLTSVSQALAQVVGALALDTVVVGSEEFRAVTDFWDAQATRHDLTVTVAEGRNGVVPVEAYAAACGDATDLVCTTHVSPHTGGRIDVSAVADAAHDTGAYCFLDASQSAGVVPIDVKRQGVDFLATGTRKFLLGPPGVAFLYVRRDLATSLTPATAGWFGIEDGRFAPGARRFEAGTPPGTAAYHADAGLELLESVGVAAVAARVERLVTRLVEGATDRGFDVVTPPDPARRAAIVVVDVADPERTVDRLREDGVVASARGGVRFGLHYYTTNSDVDRALDALASVA